MNYKGLLVAVAALGLIACGSDSDGDSENPLGENQPKVEAPNPEPDTQEPDSQQPETEEPAPEDTVDVTFLEGTWEGNNCFDINSNFDYSETIFTFSDDQITVLQPVYNSSDCTEQYQIAEYELNGTFTLGDEVIIASGETVTELDIEISSYTAMPLNASGLTFVENHHDCPDLSWDIGQVTSVYDCRVSEGWPHSIKEIAKVEDRKLYLGEYTESNDVYPAALDVEDAYIFQE